MLIHLFNCCLLTEDHKNIFISGISGFLGYPNETMHIGVTVTVTEEL